MCEISGKSFVIKWQDGGQQNAIVVSVMAEIVSHLVDCERNHLKSLLLAHKNALCCTVCNLCCWHAETLCVAQFAISVADMQKHFVLHNLQSLLLACRNTLYSTMLSLSNRGIGEEELRRVKLIDL